ncbi:MAG: complex I NDUFA9 subunit family protein [Chloroflexia bacterium]|jgi:NADH dehydrogenase|nr:complex I NDUFA9 subunit family protein [Chloroflexia bacterium]
MSSQTHERVFITGASGFVGRNILDQLADRPVVALERSDNPELDQRSNTTVVAGDVTDAGSLQGTMDGCSTVVHLVAIIEESGGATFDQVIRQGTENVLAEAKRAGIQRFIFMSALGAQDNPKYAYMQAKWRAEQAVKESRMHYTIFRPSVIFGPGDGFINALAGVVKNFPIIPVVGDGTSRFQPVHVSEVARSFAKAVNDPDATSGSTYELGGGKVYTYEEMLDVIAKALGKSKRKVHVPVALMKPVLVMSQPLPKALRPPVTQEQLKMLALDNTTDVSATHDLIGATPIRLEDGIGYIH